MESRLLSDRSTAPLAAGFTLIEMLVVLAIIIIISTIAFSSQGSFNKSIILTNAAFDVALTIRNAETYGISSRLNAGSVNTGYGVDFSHALPNTFTLFADTAPNPGTCHPHPNGATAPDAVPGDCAYGAGEKVVIYTLGNGISVRDFCAYKADGTKVCALGDALTSIDIVFSRPNPDAFISTNGLYVTPPLAFVSACLTLVAPQGGARYISVAQSGSIVTSSTPCP